MIEFIKILGLVKGYTKYVVLNVFFNIAAMIFSVFSIIMLVPIMEILFNQDGKVEALLANPPNTAFLSEGYSLKDHGFYYLATQINEHGPEWVLLYVCILVIVGIV